MLKRITSNKIRFIFAAFLVFRLFLLNINYAEWGDSYRILRASEFIRSGSYPQDEKRQPVYSLMLAARPFGVDPVLWGRIEMLVVSVAMFWMFYKIVQQFDLSKRARKIALWLLILNPVLLYWSIRIMADVPFAFLMLLTFYLYDRWKDSLTHKELFVLGLLVGLAVLTRFEGYILGFSLGLGVFLDQGWRFTIDDRLFNRAKRVVTLLIGFLVVTLPWFLYRNPVNSTYFEEPSGRVYDLNVVYIYLVSSMFLFGFSSACYFFYKYRKELVNYSRKNVAITIFVIIELVLALIWPAAIPRLFTPVIPLLIIPLAVYVDKYFNSHEKSSFGDLLVLVGLFLIFIISQYILRLQFLVGGGDRIAVD